MAATFDLINDNAIFAGANYSFGIVLKDGTGAALNLTGATVASQIRQTPASTTVLASFVPTITSATGGTLTLSLTAAVTATIPATYGQLYHRYDVLLTRSDGVKIRLIEGDVQVDPSTTR